MDAKSQSGSSSLENESRQSQPAVFQQRLENLPVEFAPVIAVRSALRAIPLIESSWDELVRKKIEPLNRIMLPVLRATSISWASRKFPTYDMVATGAAAARATTNIGTGAAALAARAATNAAAGAAAARALTATNAAAGAATRAHAGDVAAAKMWSAAEIDITYCEDRVNQRPDSVIAELLQYPLWDGEAPDWFTPLWIALKGRLLDKDENWSVWTDWYEARLNGTQTNEALEVARATIDEKLWEQSVPNHLKHFKSLERQHGPLILEETERSMGAPLSKKLLKDNTGSESAKTTRKQPARKKAPAAEIVEEAELDYDDSPIALSDSAAEEVDFLNRSAAAFVLAARLNQVWDDRNPAQEKSNWGARLWQRPSTMGKTGFVVHIDAPWGGGKTSFTNYLTRILNPYATPGRLPDWYSALHLDDETVWPKAYRRPWHIVQFNAWQHQHVSPPWWAFYDTIQKQLLWSAHNEEFSATPSKDKLLPPEPHEDYTYLNRPLRLKRWIGLKSSEIWWRLCTPELKKSAFTLVLVALLGALFYMTGIVNIDGSGKLKIVGFTVAEDEFSKTLAAVFAAVLGGGSVLWSLANSLGKSLMPGTPEAAKNYSYGSNDPMDRFRKHFQIFLNKFRRPVLVVVDDLDRCKPEFVVDLVRGMQTVLQSSRIVFVLLGDRDWIEQAFSNQHKEMKHIDVGPEHEFGARFVEKAIQLSFVLPDVSPGQRDIYVRHILKIDDENPDAKAGHSIELEILQAQTKQAVLQASNLEAREKAVREQRTIIEDSDLSSVEKASAESELSITATTSTVTSQEAEQTQHRRLVAIAHLLPANPRQIKRIVNTVGLFQEVARLNNNIDPETEEWQILVRWIVLMIEWPKTWYTLSKYPALADKIHNSRKRGLVPADAKQLIDLIKQDAQVMALLDMKSVKGWNGGKIDAAHITWLRAIVPNTSGSLLQPTADSDA